MSHTDPLGVPLAHPPAATVTTIKPKSNTLCWPWKHKYVLTGNVIMNVKEIPLSQEWACRNCGKLKFTEIPR